MGARYAWAVIVHLNGQLVPRDQAKISPLDRGFVFGDGVYEGLRTIDWRGNGHAGAREMARSGARVIGLQLHVERLYAGLEAARIETPRHEFAGLEDLAAPPYGVGRFRERFARFAYDQAINRRGEVIAVPTDIANGATPAAAV